MSPHTVPRFALPWGAFFGSRESPPINVLPLQFHPSCSVPPSHRRLSSFLTPRSPSRPAFFFFSSSRCLCAALCSPRFDVPLGVLVRRTVRRTVSRAFPRIVPHSAWHTAFILFHHEDVAPDRREANDRGAHAPASGDQLGGGWAGLARRHGHDGDDRGTPRGVREGRRESVGLGRY